MDQFAILTLDTFQDLIDKIPLEGTLKGIPKLATLLSLEPTNQTNFKHLREHKHLEITKKDQLTDKVIEISLQNDFNLVPGDSIGILCPNTPESVARLEQRLQLKQEYFKAIPTVGHLAHDFGVLDALRFAVDITSLPSKQLMRHLSNCTSDPNERKQLLYLCSMSGNTLMRDLRSKNLTFPEFLDLFPHCQPSIQDLLQLLPPLAPRYYSCSSISKDTISFVFDVHPFGLCTNWLKSKVVGEAIPVFERDPRLSHFKMEDKPALMIGAGTGIAPFLSFLDSKQPKVLIYGHRTKQDAIHLEKIQQSDAVFYECLSKEESKYQYVYQVLPNLDPQVLESSVIYICGSLKMGKSVMDVLETIKPPEYWKERLLQKTLKRDVWG